MPKPYFLDIIGNISTSSRVIGNIAGANFAEGEKIVVELDNLYDAVYTLAKEKDTLASENADLTRRVQELELENKILKSQKEDAEEIAQDYANGTIEPPSVVVLEAALAGLYSQPNDTDIRDYAWSLLAPKLGSVETGDTAPVQPLDNAGNGACHCVKCQTIDALVDDSGEDA